MASIIVHNDLVLPCDTVLAAGLQVTLQRANERARASNGNIAVNVLQSRTLRKVRFDARALTFELLQELIGLFEATDAGAEGFLMEDPMDSFTDGEGVLVPLGGGGSPGFGYGVPQYQMSKQYRALGTSVVKSRRITRPELAAEVQRNGVPVLPGIDNETGIVTFNPDVFQFPSSFATGVTTTINFPDGAGIVAAMSIGQRVWLTGVTGTAAVTLNDKAHVVTAKGATSITIDTNTAGMTATAGDAQKFPQTTDELTWEGRYFIPVHFATDDFDWSLIKPGAGEEDRLFVGTGVELDEVPE